MLGDASAALVGIDAVEAAQRVGQFGRFIADVSRAAVDDDLGDGAATECDHRSTACHGFDHNHAERLFPLHREQQAARFGEQPPLVLGVGLAEDDVLGCQARLDLPLEVVLFDRFGALAGEDQRHPDRVRRVQRQVRRLVGVEPPQEEAVPSLVAPEREGLGADRVVDSAGPVEARRELALPLRDGNELDLLADRLVEGVQVLVDGAVHGDHRGQTQGLVGDRVERPGAGVLVDDVQARSGGELADGIAGQRRLEDLGHRLAQALGDRARPDRDEVGLRAVLADADQRHVVAPLDQGVGQVGDDGLDAAVTAGRDREVRRHHHRHAQRPAVGLPRHVLAGAEHPPCALVGRQFANACEHSFLPPLSRLAARPLMSGVSARSVPELD